MHKSQVKCWATSKHESHTTAWLYLKVNITKLSNSNLWTVIYVWMCIVHTHVCIQYMSVYLWMVITSFPWDVNSGYFQLLHGNLFRFLDLVALAAVEIFIEINRRFSASLESLVWIWETWNTSWSSTWKESEVGEGLHSNKTQGRHLQKRADMASSEVTAVKGEGEEISRGGPVK